MNPDSLNLKTLRRYDAEITSIIDKTTAVLYFCSEAGWDEAEALGTLFLIERRTYPYYQLRLQSRWEFKDYSICFSNVDAIDVDGQFITLAIKHGKTAGLHVHQEAHVHRFVENMRLMHKLMVWYQTFARVTFTGDITWKGTRNIKAVLEDIADVFTYGTQEVWTLLPPFALVVDLHACRPVRDNFRFTFRMTMKLRPYQFRT